MKAGRWAPVCVDGAWYVVRPDSGCARYLWPLGCAAFTLLELLPTTPGAGAWPDEVGAALAAARANEHDEDVADMRAQLYAIRRAGKERAAERAAAAAKKKSPPGGPGVV